MSVDLEEHTNSTGDIADVDAPKTKLTRDAWLHGATDLDEGELYVEALGGVVQLRALSAGQMATMQSQCLQMKGDVAKVDTRRLGVLKFCAGVVVEPRYSEDEGNSIAHKFGPSFDLVIKAIEELSQATEEDVAKAMRRFRPKR